MPFEFQTLEIPDIILIKPILFSDERGFFLETYKESDFFNAGIDVRFVQDNHSMSKKGVLRGLHYQKEPSAQGKLIRCIRGEIWDVAVDIRKGSPWYGRWIGVNLSEENRLMLYIPSGFAHGFCVLSDVAEILYKTTSEYSPEHDRGIIWNDPELNIKWPIDNPLLSPKDAGLPFLKDADNNFIYGK